MKERVGEEGSKEARWDEETGKEKKGAKKNNRGSGEEVGGGGAVEGNTPGVMF